MSVPRSVIRAAVSCPALILCPSLVPRCSLSAAQASDAVQLGRSNVHLSVLGSRDQLAVGRTVLHERVETPGAFGHHGDVLAGLDEHPRQRPSRFAICPAYRSGLYML
jgi:hypothetical protein